MIQMSFRLLALGISLTIISTDLSAQTRSERKAIKRLKADIEYLASDELEGRRTGSEGEQKAAAYIESQYRKEGIAPFRDQYQHPFQFTYGREIAPASSISIGGDTTGPEAGLSSSLQRQYGREYLQRDPGGCI